MNYLLAIILLLILFPAQSDDLPNNTQIQKQQNEQEQCYQQRFQHCVGQCLKTKTSGCNQLCSENAKNECRQAGE